MAERTIRSVALPGNVIEEAFSDAGDCVPRQLGAVLKIDWEELEGQLEDIEGHGGEISMATLLEWCNSDHTHSSFTTARR